MNGSCLTKKNAWSVSAKACAVFIVENENESMRNCLCGQIVLVLCYSFHYMKSEAVNGSNVLDLELLARLHSSKMAVVNRK
jgi:hypothetical protein